MNPRKRIDDIGPRAPWPLREEIGQAVGVVRRRERAERKQRIAAARQRGLSAPDAAAWADAA